MQITVKGSSPKDDRTYKDVLVAYVACATDKRNCIHLHVLFSHTASLEARRKGGQTVLSECLTMPQLDQDVAAKLKRKPGR